MKRSTALLTAIAALGLSWPWLRAGAGWPKLVVQQLDHCPQVACDFVLYYLPQVRLLYESPGEVVHGWVYPPLLAMLLQGLKLFPDGTAALIWTGLNLGLAAGLGWLCAQALPRSAPALARGVGAAALVGLSLPVLHALKWGQVSLLVVVLALVGLRRGGRLGGALVGLAAAVKIYPAVFLAMPLARRRWEEGAAGVVTGAAAGVLLPVLALGWAAAWPFYRGLLTMQEVSVAGLGGQALSPSMFRWFVDGRHIERLQRPLTDDSALLFGLPGEQVFVVLLVFAAVGAAAWRVLDARTSRSAAAAMTVTAVALALPPGWHHYFVFLPFAQAAALGRGRVSTGLALASAAVTMVPVLALTERPEMYFEYSKWGGTTAAALLALAALICVPLAGSDPGEDATPSANSSDQPDPPVSP